MPTSSYFRRAAIGLGVALATAGGLSSCQQGDSADQSKEVVAESDTTEDLKQMFEGLHASYDPAPSPDALAEQSDLVVSGSVVDVIPGRTYDDGLSRTVTFVVQVGDELTAADQPEQAYVEMWIPGSLPPEEVQRYFPPDLPVSFFLIEAPTAEEISVDDERAGRPEGAPLYMPVSPQGFWVGAPQGRLLMPLDHQEFPDVDISEVLPPASEYPPSVLVPGEGDGK